MYHRVAWYEEVLNVDYRGSENLEEVRVTTGAWNHMVSHSWKRITSAETAGLLRNKHINTKPQTS